jgi:hypothetical protein
VHGEDGDTVVAEPVEAHLAVDGLGEDELAADLFVHLGVGEHVGAGVHPEIAQVVLLGAKG